MATEAYARSLIAEMPLFQEGGQYVPQTEEVLNDIANRIWQAVKDLLTPFSGEARQLVQPLLLLSTRLGLVSAREGSQDVHQTKRPFSTCKRLQHSLENIPCATELHVVHVLCDGAPFRVLVFSVCCVFDKK